MSASKSRSLNVSVERFDLAAPFVISRGARSVAEVVSVTIEEGLFRGRGECVPYGRFGETLDGVVASIAGLRGAVEAGVERDALQSLLPAGAARNALDCALWDLEAKRLGVRAHELAGLHRVAPVVTAFTLSLGSPQAMAEQAVVHADKPLLKLKLGGVGDEARLAAVRAAAPRSDLIVDANEAWRPDDLPRLFDACAEAGVLLIEQPLPQGRDEALIQRPRSIPVCADESIHDREGLAALRERYDLINIKLDKTGGLTEAFLLADEAQRLGFGLFLGCMVGTSLAMAPALMLAPRCRFVDLDGPLLLARDRSPGLVYEDCVIQPPGPEVWG
jgi:L-alanine-DL-glutamate epimerase-like enolase superfamily enzyme